VVYGITLLKPAHMNQTDELFVVGATGAWFMCASERLDGVPDSVRSTNVMLLHYSDQGSLLSADSFGSQNGEEAAFATMSASTKDGIMLGGRTSSTFRNTGDSPETLLPWTISASPNQVRDDTSRTRFATFDLDLSFYALDGTPKTNAVSGFLTAVDDPSVPPGYFDAFIFRWTPHTRSESGMSSMVWHRQFRVLGGRRSDIASLIPFDRDGEHSFFAVGSVEDSSYASAAYLLKVDEGSGDVAWAQSISAGSSPSSNGRGTQFAFGAELAQSVAVVYDPKDPDNHRVCVLGTTQSRVLHGQTNHGQSDLFVSCFVATETSAFHAGQHDATFVIGTSKDDSGSKMVSSGNELFIAGHTSDDLSSSMGGGGGGSFKGGSRDGFVLKLTVTFVVGAESSFCVVEWVRQIGTSQVDRIKDLMVLVTLSSSLGGVPEKQILAVGETLGVVSDIDGTVLVLEESSNNQGKGDAFVTSINPTTSKLTWMKRISTSERDYVSGMAVSSTGDANLPYVYLTGYTSGSMHFVRGGEGASNFGNDDAFLLRLRSPGTQAYKANSDFVRDDAGASEVSFSQTSITLRENAGATSVTVSRTLPPIQDPLAAQFQNLNYEYCYPLSFKVTATPLRIEGTSFSATVDLDYTGGEKTIRLSPGITQASYTFNIFQDDEYEYTESFKLELTMVHGFGTIGEKGTCLVIIDDDEVLRDENAGETGKSPKKLNVFNVVAICIGCLCLLLFLIFVAIPIGRQQYKRKRATKRNLELIAQAEEEAYYKAVKESRDTSNAVVVINEKGEEVRGAMQAGKGENVQGAMQTRKAAGRIGPEKTNLSAATPYKNEEELCQEMAQRVIEHFNDVTEDNLEEVIEYVVSEIQGWARKNHYALVPSHMEAMTETVVDKLFEVFHSFVASHHVISFDLIYVLSIVVIMIVAYLVIGGRRVGGRRG
jgi:hypothetical protein